MASLLKFAAKFVLVIFVMAIVCTFQWGVVADSLYDCTDAVGLDYLRPGDWIHGSFDSVPVVVHGRSMSEPDTIRQGWNLTGLWGLWISFVVVSLFVSILAACFPWLTKHRREQALVG
jgi:hypothetical protein